MVRELQKIGQSLKDRVSPSDIELPLSSSLRSPPVSRIAGATPFCTCFWCAIIPAFHPCHCHCFCGLALISPLQQSYLGLGDGDAETFSNAFLTVVALSGIVGAIYADVYAGAFKVQWQASIVWAIGAALLFYLTLSSLSQGVKLAVAAIAWALLAFGLGSMMPSQAAFVGQQLVDPNPVR